MQDQSYKLNGVEVSDFVFPLYFTVNKDRHSRKNYLKDKPVESFSATSGGYIGYYDFDLKKDMTWFPENDERSRARHAVKSVMGLKRRIAKANSLFLDV